VDPNPEDAPMSEKAEQLKPVLAALSAEDRAELLDYLAGLEEGEELTPEEWEAAWSEEINRRVADAEAGRTKLVPWEEVSRKMREKYG
jgi:putative addiction module component (TIGR02574 family)